jgi:hypothetical protein
MGFGVEGGGSASSLPPLLTLPCFPLPSPFPSLFLNPSKIVYKIISSRRAEMARLSGPPRTDLLQSLMTAVDDEGASECEKGVESCGRERWQVCENVWNTLAMQERARVSLVQATHHHPSSTPAPPLFLSLPVPTCPNLCFVPLHTSFPQVWTTSLSETS